MVLTRFVLEVKFASTTNVSGVGKLRNICFNAMFPQHYFPGELFPSLARLLFSLCVALCGKLLL